MVAAQISQQLSIAVSYEEPAWLSDAELMRYVDTPDIRTRPPEVIARIDPKLKAALIGTVEAKANLQPGQDEVQLAGLLLQESLEYHAKRGNPGRFKLVRLDDYGYSIVPTHVRGKTGQLVPVSSPLDVRISFPHQKRSLASTLVLIAQAISKKSGEDLEADIFNLPGINSIFDVANANIGADKEIARDVLARTLREMHMYNDAEPGPMMTWQLIRRMNKVPGFSKDYALRFELVTHLDTQGRSEILHWPTKAGK